MSLIPLQQSLPQPVYSATDVLSHEKVVAKSFGLSLYQLMERAGQATFDYLAKHYDKHNTLLVLCGKGNNGGDGFVIARLAIEYGYHVQTISLVEEKDINGDAKQALSVLHQVSPSVSPVLFISNLAEVKSIIDAFQGELIVDAIFGIGFKGTLSEEYNAVIKAVNENQAEVLSVDVPSGLNATTGNGDGIIATATVTFIAIKQGLLTGVASHYVGRIIYADLEVATEFVSTLKSKIIAQGRQHLPCLAARTQAMHKGNIGLALTVGGNENMPGAIRLASEAALRTGAALVAVCCHKDNHNLMLNGRPELMLAPDTPAELAQSRFFDKAGVIVIGPGLGSEAWAVNLFELMCEHKSPLIVDADALRILSRNPQKRDDWVLTPHPGEAAHLLGTDTKTIEKDRFSAVTEITQRYGGICVLKGAGSLICDGERTWINQTGNSGMATGGMGDVLSGIIAALILQSPSVIDAVRLAVSIHGQAADSVANKYGQRGLLASDLFEPLRCLVNQY